MGRGGGDEGRWERGGGKGGVRGSEKIEEGEVGK